MPTVMRVAWWLLVACDLVLVGDVIAAAWIFGRPMFFLFLLGPMSLAAVLVLVAWWHTRGPGRSSWRSQ